MRPRRRAVADADGWPRRASSKPRTNRVPDGTTLSRFFHDLGPGLISGAADDDPSGISTYSVAGAFFGYSQLWIALFSFPLMAAVQLMCARLGKVTGRGLAGTVRRHYSRRVLWTTCSLLLVANIFNIAADLAGMAEATAMMTGINAKIFVPAYGLVILGFLFFSTYRQIARIFKWLTLVLFAYVLCAFVAQPHWGEVLRATVIPHLEWSADYLSTVVGILGTTISPYLFFWQASQEVEEDVAKGQHTLTQRQGASNDELAALRIDVLTGMFFSNLVMYFIILTTAATLHAHGHTHIGSAQEAAEALRPLAGDAAYVLFTLGLIGTGMLGVPVLAGACAYAVAEGAAWRGSLDQLPNEARRFYAVVTVAVALGLVLAFAGFNAVAMLFWSAVLNGVLASPLIVVVVRLTSDPTVMGRRVNPPVVRWLGWTTALIMAVAALAMFTTAFT